LLFIEQYFTQRQAEEGGGPITRCKNAWKIKKGDGGSDSVLPAGADLTGLDREKSNART